MAIYHLCVKPISRSSGRSSTGSAAYRAACLISDQRTGISHDFTRKRGVESADIVLPHGAPKWAEDRSALWNAAERAEKRKDACTAREVEVALPAELSSEERRRLALDFALEMASLEGCAVDVAIHAPSRGGDQRNWHAHMMRTTRRIGPEGVGEKLESERAGRNRRDDLERLRLRWAELCNLRLLENRIHASIDHRSLEERGTNRKASAHLGPVITAIKRRGIKSCIQARLDSEVAARLRTAYEQGERDRQQAAKAPHSHLVLSTNIEEAKQEQQLREERHNTFDRLLGQVKTEACSTPQHIQILDHNGNHMEP